MNATDDEVRIYRGTVDPRPGRASQVEVEGSDGTHPLVNHTATDFAWGYGGAGPSTLAQCIVIDALGSDARCRRCVGGGIDPDTGREAAKCRDCGGDGRSDVVDLVAPVVKDQLLAPLDKDVPFELTADEVMDVILRLCLDPPDPRHPYLVFGADEAFASAHSDVPDRSVGALRGLVP